MLSGKLVQLIETHSNAIADHVVQIIRHHPDLPALAGGPEPELREWCQDILSNIGYWLSASQTDELKRRYEVLGKLRFEQEIPLHEAVLRFFILKNAIRDFIHSQGMAITSVQLHAEEELDQRISRFFEAMVYHLVRGYEGAMRLSMRLAY
jgi:hypothetical protein